MPDSDRALIELAGIPAALNLDQYFGLWAIDDTHFAQLLHQVSKMDLAAHCASGRPIVAASVRRQSDEPQKAIALIDIQGTMTKRGSSLSDAGATVLIRQAVRQAAADPDVGAILLRIDSPGGTAAGTGDLARAVADANKVKPVYAFIEDLGASAAYWVASQADKVFANTPDALVGSIGTYTALYDTSMAAAQQGVRAVVIRSGKFKGTGVPGTEIDQEQQQMLQQIVDETQAEFSAAIAAGRNLSTERVAELADGRIHTATVAKTLGLIDAIQSFDATIGQLQGQIRPANSISSTRRSSAMSETITPPSLPVAATLADLKANCPNASGEFLLAQLGNNATVDQARAAWIGDQTTRLAEATTEIAALKTALAESKAQVAALKARPGVQPIGGAPAADGGIADPRAAWNEAIAAALKAGAKSKLEAGRIVDRRNPELRQALLEAGKA